MPIVVRQILRPLLYPALCLSVLLSGCERSAPLPTSPTTAPQGATQPGSPDAVSETGGGRTVRMRVGAEEFTLEVAATDEDRQRGLMHRNSMPRDRGMIFVFPDEAPRRFWMRNTLIPLDILYVSAAGYVVHVVRMEPLDERGAPSMLPAKYAIELNAGAAARAGAKAGDRLAIPAEAQHTAD